MTALYRLHDRNSALLYVGITDRLEERMIAHSRKAWGPRISECSVEQFSDRASARSAEAHAIRTEHPRFNIRMETAPIPSPLGAAVREGRIAKGWRLERLAAEVSVSTDTLRRAEQGHVVKFGTLARIAEALELSLPDLVALRAS